MLTKLEVLGLRSLVPTLPLDDDGHQNNDPIQVLDIKGLEPVKAAITTTAFGAFDGEALTGMSVGKRNIVLQMGLNPDWAIQSVEELRQLLYNYFMPKLMVQLRFHSTNFPVAQIIGYVEDVSPNIFAKSPQMQVSIICPAPDFLAVEPTVVTGITNDGTSLQTIDYVGSVPTGIGLQIDLTTGLPGIDSIQVSLSGQYAPQVFVAKGNIAPDIRWEMSSIPGGKFIRSVSMLSGAVQNFLNDLAPDATWPVLYPGENKIAVITPVVGQNWELTYTARFGGL